MSFENHSEMFDSGEASTEMSSLHEETTKQRQKHEHDDSELYPDDEAPGSPNDRRSNSERMFYKMYGDSNRKERKTRSYFGGGFIVGPGWQWITPACLLLFTVLVHWFTVKMMDCEKAQNYKIFVHVASLLTGAVLFWTAFTNPGQVFRKMTYREYIQYSDQEAISCYHCLALNTDKATHCGDCGVCVKNLDHHCIVMGNCIGKYNLCAFYTMLGSVVLGLLTVYMGMILGLQQCYME